MLQQDIDMGWASLHFCMLAFCRNPQGLLVKQPQKIDAPSVYGGPEGVAVYKQAVQQPTKAYCNVACLFGACVLPLFSQTAQASTCTYRMLCLWIAQVHLLCRTDQR